MTRALVLVATLLFWLGVGGFAWQAWRAGDGGATAIAAAGTPAAHEPTERRITIAELARHASAADCWLAIDGVVYDISAYGPRHPAEPEVLEAWCGREASAAYRTKGLPSGGQPHSARADAMLPRYRIGTLAP